MVAIQELDTVVLTRDHKEHGLVAGDVGAVVHSYGDHQAFEVEFVMPDGNTIAVLTLGNDEIREINIDDVLHVRHRAS